MTTLARMHTRDLELAQAALTTEQIVGFPPERTTELTNVLAAIDGELEARRELGLPPQVTAESVENNH